MYDMYTPILGDAPIRYSYEEAKAKTLEALQPLGEEYLAVLEEAFDSRWIDVVENQGKRSGAYSSGGYDTAPYILMNWHDSLDQPVHAGTRVRTFGSQLLYPQQPTVCLRGLFNFLS